MNLVIDKGNTNLKYAFFDESFIVEHGSGEAKLLRAIEGKCFNVIVSGSADLESEVEKKIHSASQFFIKLNSLTPTPLKGIYKTMGTDRIADCVGSMVLAKQKNVLAIDLGTAITYNIVSSEGVFCGGAISPGHGLRFNSLHNNTAHLPLLKIDDNNFNDFSSSTDAAILSGVINGIVFEINGFERKFVKQYSDGVVIITGGSAPLYYEKLNGNETLEKNLGLIGLNTILNFNMTFTTN